MRRALERRGLEAVDEAAAVHEGELLADGLTQMPWYDLLGSFEPGTKQYAELYRRMGALSDEGGRPDRGAAAVPRGRTVRVRQARARRRADLPGAHLGPAASVVKVPIPIDPPPALR
jgi:hypothetical protein